MGEILWFDHFSRARGALEICDMLVADQIGFEGEVDIYRSNDDFHIHGPDFRIEVENREVVVGGNAGAAACWIDSVFRRLSAEFVDLDT